MGFVRIEILKKEDAHVQELLGQSNHNEPPTNAVVVKKVR